MKKLMCIWVATLLFGITAQAEWVEGGSWLNPPSHIPYVGFVNGISWPGVYYGNGMEIFVDPGTLQYGADSQYKIGDTFRCYLFNYNGYEDQPEEYSAVITGNGVLEEDNGLFVLMDQGDGVFILSFKNVTSEYPMESIIQKIDEKWNTVNVASDWVSCYRADLDYSDTRVYLSLVNLYNSGDYAVYYQYEEYQTQTPVYNVKVAKPLSDTILAMEYDDDMGRVCYSPIKRESNRNLRIFYGPVYADELNKLDAYVDDSEEYEYLWDRAIWE